MNSLELLWLALPLPGGDGWGVCENRVHSGGHRNWVRGHTKHGDPAADDGDLQTKAFREAFFLNYYDVPWETVPEEITPFLEHAKRREDTVQNKQSYVEDMSEIYSRLHKAVMDELPF